jgi:acetyltransferase
MEALIAYCRARGTQELAGDALRENTGILRLASSLGFQHASGDSGLVRLRLPLQSA